MKKSISTVLCLTLIISLLAGCGQTGTQTAAQADAQTGDIVVETASVVQNDTELDVEDAEPYPSKQDVTLTSANRPFYFYHLDSSKEYPVYFVNGEEDIPYIDMDTALELLQKVYRDGVGYEDDMGIKVDSNDSQIAWMRGDNFTYVDFAQGTIGFQQYEAFFRPEGAGVLDVLSIYTDLKDDDGNSRYINTIGNVYLKKGHPLEFSLKKHGIDIFLIDKKGYIPLQTFSDIYLSPLMSFVAYNGEICIITSDVTEDAEVRDLYYSVPEKDRSEELAEFTYKELCLALVANYGLKEKHNITGTFEEFFELVGEDENLMSPDFKVYNAALVRLISAYFGDFHSTLDAPSPFGKSATVNITNITTGYNRFTERIAKYNAARADQLGDVIPGYQEVGNTAYITFDHFIGLGDNDFYSEMPTEDDVADINGINVYALVIYAHNQIMRENSPIENVVVDLSCNLGGDFSSATYLSAWMLGSSAIDLYDTMCGAQSANVYKADVNLDGEFDDSDSLKSKNVYCLVSPVSFSCGNLVPAMCKEYGTVTLIGKQTGGGACAVQHLSLADGTTMSISSRIQINLEKNGAYYDVDEGITPDFTLAKIESFYDRKALTEYINELR